MLQRQQIVRLTLWTVSKYGPTNPWLTFSEYTNAVTDECTNTMLEKWKDRLGGAEQFTESHCRTMTQSQRVD
jgi:hypothetical protein